MSADPTPHLTTSALGRTLELYDSIDSTNDRAKVLVRDGAPHGLLVAARAQTAGRGRLGRVWSSPPDAGVYASFVVRPPALLLRHAPLLTLVAGVAVREAAHALVGLDGALKWPNDLWVASGPLARRKVAGVLTETSASGERLEAAVIGIGLNVREVARPPPLDGIASSLEGVTGRVVTPGEALGALANALEAALDTFLAYGAAPILARWRAHAWGLGEAVRVGEATGVLRGIADDGALLLVQPDGTERRVYAGELEGPRADAVAHGT